MVSKLIGKEIFLSYNYKIDPDTIRLFWGSLISIGVMLSIYLFYQRNIEKYVFYEKYIKIRIHFK